MQKVHSFFSFYGVCPHLEMERLGAGPDPVWTSRSGALNGTGLVVLVQGFGSDRAGLLTGLGVRLCEGFCLRKLSWNTKSARATEMRGKLLHENL